MTLRALPEPHCSQAVEQEVHLRDYWYVLLKRRWITAAVTVSFLSLSAVCSFVRTPVYKATSLIEVNRGKVNLGQEVLVRDRLPGVLEFYPTQERILESRTLAERTVEELRLWDHPLFGIQDDSDVSESPEQRQAIAQAVQGMLEASYVRNTQLIEVSFVSPDPQLSADLANALVRQYILFSSEADLGVAKATSSFLREQIEKLQEDIRKKEELLQEYSKKKDIFMLGRKDNIVVQHLEELNRQLSRAQAERAAVEARYRSLEGAAPGSLQEVAEHRDIRALREQLALARKRYAELSAKFKDDWPEMQRTRNAITELERRIEQDSREVADKVVAGARVSYESALRRERLLEKELEHQKGEAQGLNRLAADYSSVQAELDNQRQMLQQLLRRQSETGLTAELDERQPVNVRVVEAAVAPKWRYKPNVLKNVLLGVVVGICLAIGLAFFLDYWDTRIYTFDDLRQEIHIPYLGMIPRMKPNAHEAARVAPGVARRGMVRSVTGRRTRELVRGGGGGGLLPALPPDGALSREQSVLRERFKFLRGAVLLSHPGEAPKTVLVTSPEKHAGKTFVICNLAVSLAEMKKTVLVIDADLRNPHLHRVFGIRNRVGLTNVLTGQMRFEDGCILKTTVANLFVLLAGPLSPTPAELLGSEPMQSTLQRSTEHFDFVLVDSAPLLPVIDTHALASRCDAVILVARSGQTTRPAVRQSAQLVEKTNGKITGVVVNDIDLGDWAQNYYYGRTTYEYGSYPQEATPVQGHGF